MALREDANPFRRQQGFSKRQEAPERRQRARRDDTRGRQAQAFRPTRVDCRVNAQQVYGLVKERGLPLVRFHQMSVAARQEGKDQSWEAAPRAEVYERSVVGWKQAGKLRRVENMALPDFGGPGAPDQVDAGIPALEQVNKLFQLRLNVTRQKGLRRQALFHVKRPASARRRTWPLNAASAAGVIPSMRAAAPSETGRLAIRRARASSESPGTPR